MADFYHQNVQEIRIYSPVETRFYTSCYIYLPDYDLRSNNLYKGVNIFCCCNLRNIFGYGISMSLHLQESWKYELIKGETLKRDTEENFIVTFYVKPKFEPLSLFWASLPKVPNNYYEWNGDKNVIQTLGIRGTKRPLLFGEQIEDIVIEYPEACICDKIIV